MLLQVIAAVAIITISLDSNAVRRTVMVAALLGMLVYGQNTARLSARRAKADTQRRVLGRLPVHDFSDAVMFDVQRTSAQYPHIAANPRVMAMLARVRALRKFSDHTFARGLAFVEYLLKHGRPATSFTATELVLVKDHAMGVFGEFNFLVPPEYQEQMRLSDKLRALDTVLYLEAISPVARVADVYPLPGH